MEIYQNKKEELKKELYNQNDKKINKLKFKKFEFTCLFL
jgi:hypothetical protein